MIDDNTLIQAFATVLAGVLIFLTLERRFEAEKELLDRAIDLSKKRAKIIRRVQLLKADKAGFEKNLANVNELNQKDHYENRIKDTDKKLLEERLELKAVTGELNMEIDLNNRMAERYMDLKTEEGILTVTTILFLVGSILVLIVGSIVDLHAFPYDDMPPYAKIISVVFFSIGIILLVGRVYLHGKDIH